VSKIASFKPTPSQQRSPSPIAVDATHVYWGNLGDGIQNSNGAVMRVPLEGGGRLVVELNAEEAGALGEALNGVVG